MNDEIDVKSARIPAVFICDHCNEEFNNFADILIAFRTLLNHIYDNHIKDFFHVTIRVAGGTNR